MLYSPGLQQSRRDLHGVLLQLVIRGIWFKLHLSLGLTILMRITLGFAYTLI